LRAEWRDAVKPVDVGVYFVDTCGAMK
jgi:hypothetical protein